MAQQGDKHGGRIDDALDHEAESVTRGSPVEARADEHREQHGAGDGEPAPDARLSGDRGRAESDEDTLSYDEVEARTELARHLEPSVFPARPAELVESARRQHAPDALVDQLAGLPDGVFDNTEAVWEALGGRVEYRG